MKKYLQYIDLKILYSSLILAFLFLFINIDLVTYYAKDEFILSYLIHHLDFRIFNMLIYNYISYVTILYLFIYGFRFKIFGNIFIFVSILLFFIDDYIFKLNGENVFRIGINDTMIYSFILSIKEPNYMIEFFQTYKNEIIYQILIPTIIIFFVAIILKKIVLKQDYFNKKEFILFSISFIYFSYFIHPTSQAVPFFMKSYYEVSDFLYVNLTNKNREELLTKPKIEGITNIIYIMDESISYEAKEKSFLFLEKYKNEIFDFNLSYSYDNCSYSSRSKNFIGFDAAKHIEKDVLIKPTFFQYAKNSNYKTYILDNQESFLFNGLKHKDMKWIDNYQSYTKEDVINRDLNRIKDIVDILNSSNEKKFIYLKKNGAHFNYINNYPSNEITLFGEINRDNYHKEENFMKSYLNSVYWNTNLFFEKLLPLIDNENTIILYTSDHGELNYYDEDKEKFVKGHCFEHKDIKKVPIFIFSKNKEIIKNLYTNNKIIDEDNVRNHKDLYNLLLNFLGY